MELHNSGSRCSHRHPVVVVPALGSVAAGAAEVSGGGGGGGLAVCYQRRLRSTALVFALAAAVVVKSNNTAAGRRRSEVRSAERETDLMDGGVGANLYPVPTAIMQL